MRVVSMINGSLLSESASYYALSYARSVQLPFTALFVDNGKESQKAVEQSVQALQEFADANNVPFEFVQLQGEVVPQLQHFCQLYAVDTLFCATRQKSSLRSFSEKIVNSGIETDIAVVKVKNISHVRSSNRLLLVSREKINPHVFVLWLGLLRVNDATGRIYLSAEDGFAKASTKSGLKYLAAPFMQLAALSGADGVQYRDRSSRISVVTDSIPNFVIAQSRMVQKKSAGKVKLSVLVVLIRQCEGHE